MKIQARFFFKLALLAVLLCAVTAHAQSLPNKQETGLRAPANIKIDGIADEWGNKFQAYNSATELYYTLANDNDNLYLIVQATRPRIIEKIMNVGITLVINAKDEKSDKSPDNVSICFPLIDYLYVPQIIVNAGDQTKAISYEAGGGPENSHYYKSEFEKKPSDSLKDAATKLLTEKAKEIKITGLPELPEGELSIYNDVNVKVAMAFDHKGAYTYELKVPLKFIHLSIADTKKFRYSIKLQNRQDVARRGMVTDYHSVNGHVVSDDLDLDSTTDFWGEYTLAKK